MSPEFAMSKMDDAPHYECDLYVEDERAGRLLTEILVKFGAEFVQRCRVIPFGAASVGLSLGTMVRDGRFPTGSCVFLDGDQEDAPGCMMLPGDDAPERVVFVGLKELNWTGLDARTGRAFADVADACERAMTEDDHHGWVASAANHLVLGGDTLWQAMCAQWVGSCLKDAEGKRIATAVEDVMQGASGGAPQQVARTRGANKAVARRAPVSKIDAQPKLLLD